MKAQILLRQIHRWGSLAIMIPIGVAIVAGLLLMWKKESAWIQPPSAVGSAPGAVPTRSVAELFAAAAAVPELELAAWTDLARVEARPKEGVFKFIAANRWEAQIDAATGDVLQVAYRRSDLIEAIHDGSFFAGWTKHFLFFPSGVVLVVLWATGVYLFFLPHVKHALNACRKPGSKR